MQILPVILAGLFVFLALISLLLVLIFKPSRSVVNYTTTKNDVRRCPICGQILENEWNRCPFCVGDAGYYYNQNAVPMGIIKREPPIAWLVNYAGPERGKEQRIQRVPFTIGSNINNALIIQDNMIANEHAVIVLENRTFILRHVGLGCQTKINAQTVQTIELRDGDIIVFGNSLPYIFKQVD